MKKISKNTTNLKTTFVRTTVAPCVEQVSTTTYRARVSLKGTRYYNTFTNLKTATKWVKEVRRTGNPKVKV